MNSVSSPLPMIETNAVPISPASATVGSAESGRTARSRRCRPAAKTTSSTAPRVVKVWKAYMVGTCSTSRAVMPAGSPTSSGS